MRRAFGLRAKAAPAAFQLMGGPWTAPSPLWAPKWGWLFDLWDPPALTSIYSASDLLAPVLCQGLGERAGNKTDKVPELLEFTSGYGERQALETRDASQRVACWKQTKQAGVMEVGMAEQATSDRVLTGSEFRGTCV